MDIEQKTKKSNKVLRALPLAFLDFFATIIAYVVGPWGTRVIEDMMAIGHIGYYVLFLAAINVVAFALLKMYTTLWEYASMDEAVRIVIAVTVGSVVGDILAVILFGGRLPFRVYLSAWAINLIICSATRFVIRAYSGKKSLTVFGINQSGALPRSLIVGAGETGSLTVKRMLGNDPDISGCPVVLVDDDQNKVGQYIHGIKVAGTCEDIPELAARLGIEQIVMAAPSATKSERDRIYQICMSTGVRTLTLPNVRDIPTEELGHIALRDVEISDLLAREEKPLVLDQMGYITGKRILVTGGGGSIGSELVRQLLPAHPAQIILFDIYENTTYELYHELVNSAAEQGTELKTYIGSITHMPAIGDVFETYHPHVVFHAAAHKHVPLMESNAREAIENNVFGTLNVVRLADQYGCTHFVQISTDKAVNPTNVMGATKRMDEMIVQYYASISKTKFACVRFGNVLGSHGSVIPLFKRQLKEGGPITLTHRDIRRYFMTIPEASRLVITAGALAHGGEIFVLNMGEPVKIYDLAVNLITLSGLKVGRDIEIKEVGLRPGEKMYEELLMPDEELLQTENKDIRISTAEADKMEQIEGKLSKLQDCLESDNDAIKRVLAEVVPTYHPQF